MKKADNNNKNSKYISLTTNYYFTLPLLYFTLLRTVKGYGKLLLYFTIYVIYSKGVKQYIYPFGKVIKKLYLIWRVK